MHNSELRLHPNCAFDCPCFVRVGYKDISSYLQFLAIVHAYTYLVFILNKNKYIYIYIHMYIYRERERFFVCLFV